MNKNVVNCRPGSTLAYISVMLNGNVTGAFNSALKQNVTIQLLRSGMSLGNQLQFNGTNYDATLVQVFDSPMNNLTSLAVPAGGGEFQPIEGYLKLF